MEQLVKVPKTIRLKRREFEKLHEGFVQLGWSITRLSIEANIDRDRAKFFARKKFASLYTGMKIALVISSALAVGGSKC